MKLKFKLFEKIIISIEKLSDRLGIITSWFTALLVVIICYDVVTRYLFKESSVALQELEWHIFGFIFLVASAYTLKIDDHVRVDVLYTKFTIRKKALINLLGTIFFLIPFCVVVIIVSFKFAKMSFMLNEGSPDSGGLPARYILKFVIPLSFVFLLLQSVADLLKSILILISSKNVVSDD